MPQNRPSDLVDQRRNSFGLAFPNHTVMLGTKGDVETFFLVLNDLISNGFLEDRYKTISHDLFRTLVNSKNFKEFKIETEDLKVRFSEILSSRIDWKKYPFNREMGIFDYQKKCIDPKKKNISDVFFRFFEGFEKSHFWIEESLARGGKYSRIIISPTEIRSSRKFKKIPDEELMRSVDNPMWLQEPA